MAWRKVSFLTFEGFLGLEQELSQWNPVMDPQSPDWDALGRKLKHRGSSAYDVTVYPMSPS
jgi:hypothetical protein